MNHVIFCAAKKELRRQFKKTMANQLGTDLKHKEIETDLFIIKTENQNGKKEGGESLTGSDHTTAPINYNNLFQSKHPNIKRVLTMGLGHIGKTFHAQKFMLDWARGNSNKNIDMLFSIDLEEFSSTENVSLEELLDRFLGKASEHRISEYKEYKITFVLDSLDKCKLPLDFHSPNDLTDIKEPASVSRLLTNLIKGKLLPSACVWILTRHSAADKIPPEFIDQVTECQGMF